MHFGQGWKTLCLLHPRSRAAEKAFSPTSQKNRHERMETPLREMLYWNQNLHSLWHGHSLNRPAALKTQVARQHTRPTGPPARAEGSLIWCAPDHAWLIRITSRYCMAKSVVVFHQRQEDVATLICRINEFT